MSGSGQDTPVSYTQATAAPETGGLGDFLKNKDFQKYLTDLGAGMAGQRDFNAAMGSGLARAGAGLSESLGRQAEFERAKQSKEEERKRQVELIRNIIGGDGQLSPELFNDPKTAMAAGMKLISSGDPALMEQGKNIMAIGSTLQKSTPDQWITTSQDIGGRSVPVQINAKTGEVKPYSADLINGPQVSYVPELRTFVDKYGNPVTPGQGQPQGMQGQQPQAPISNFTNQSITQPTAPIGVSPTIPSLPEPKYDMNLTPAENAKARQDWQTAQRGLETDVAKTQIQTQQKKIEEATNYFNPDNQQSIQAANEQSKALLEDLKTQIPLAHTLPGSNLRPIQSKYVELGAEGVSQLEATARNLVATKIGQMKSAGVVSAGQLNSDKDIDLQFGAIFDIKASKAVQEKQLARLEKDMLDADKKIAAQEAKYKSYLGQPTETTNINPKIDKTQLGKVVEKGGKKYKITATGYEEL